MQEATTLHFVRHGLVHNPDQVYYGRLPDFHIGDKGLAQAQAAAKILSRKPISAVFSSPMERTIETAEAILKAFDGLQLQITKQLIEVHSPFDGQALNTIAERKWDIYTDTPPPYEQPADLLCRLKNFVKTVRKEYLGKEVIAVTHGDVIVFMTLFAMRKPITQQTKQRYFTNTYPDHASITSFTYQTLAEHEVPVFTAHAHGQ